MSTDTLDTLDTEDNFVPEPTAANPDGGAERLDADPVSTDTHASLDALLDEAERESTPTHTEANEDDHQASSIENPEPAATPIEGSGNASGGSGDPVGDNLGLQQQAPEIDPEILAIEQPRNLSEKNQNNWRKLQETASTYKKQAEEAQTLRQKLAEAESRPTATPPDYEELKRFRAIFDIKNDPEFQSKYQEPLKGAKEQIYSILKKNGASDELIAGIESAGGPDKVDQNWWKTNAIDKLQFTDAERLKKGLMDIVDLKEKQQAEIEHAAQNAEQILEQRKNASIESYRRDTETIGNHLQELTKDLPWARYQQASATATPEELQAVQQHNAMVQQLERKFQTALWPTDAKSRANIAASAVLSEVLSGQLRQDQSRIAQLNEQIKSLSEENSKLKGASKVPRQNVSTPSTIKSASVNDRIKMSSLDAIELGLSEAGD
jgi:hypothetical protein